MMLASVAGAIFVVPVIVGAGIFVGILTLLTIGVYTEAGSSRDTIVALGVIVLALAGNAYFAAPRRPMAHIQMENHQRLAGPLVTSTSDSWYLAVPKRMVTAVPQESVATATIAPGPRRMTQHSFQEISGFPRWLAGLVGFGVFGLGFTLVFIAADRDERRPVTSNTGGD
jgi:hypothetical protein